MASKSFIRSSSIRLLRTLVSLTVLQSLSRLSWGVPGRAHITLATAFPSVFLDLHDPIYSGSASGLRAFAFPFRCLASSSFCFFSFSHSVIVAFFKARCCFFLSRSFALAASCFWSSFQTVALKWWDLSVAVNAGMTSEVLSWSGETWTWALSYKSQFCCYSNQAWWVLKGVLTPLLIKPS